MKLPFLAVLLFLVYVPKTIASVFLPIVILGLAWQVRQNILKNLTEKSALLIIWLLMVLVTLLIEPVEIIRLLPLFFMVVFFPYKGVSLRGISFIACFVLIYSVAFQILIGMVDLSAIEYRQKFYPIENNPWPIANLFDGIDSFRGVRLAGLFYNPNVMASFTLISYMILLVLSESKQVRVIFGIIVLISLFLAGSRTYFLIYIMFMMVSTSVGRLKYLYLLLVPLGVVIIVDKITKYFVEDFSSDQGSMSIKTRILLDYFKRLMDEPYGFVSFILGGEFKVQFDSDIGYILGAWGLIGGLLYLIAISIYLKKNPQSLKYMLLIMLSMFSNSLFYGLLTAFMMMVLMIAISSKKVKF